MRTKSLEDLYADLKRLRAKVRRLEREREEAKRRAQPKRRNLKRMGRTAENE